MLEKYRNQSYRFAEKRGIFSALTQDRIEEDYDFICKEGWARALGERVVRDIFGGKVKIKQMYLFNGYDMEVVLENGVVIKIEIKCRGEKYTKPFKELAVSANENKSDLIEEGEGWILEYYDALDKWWIWKLEEYTPEFRDNSYTHKKWTAEHKDNHKITEGAYYFDRNKASLSGKTYTEEWKTKGKR